MGSLVLSLRKQGIHRTTTALQTGLYSKYSNGPDPAARRE